VARLAPPVMGKFVGEVAEAIDKLDPQGYVLYQGEYWSAQAESPVEKGEKVVIVAKDGSILKVRRR
jgi:membrane-bound serine protease (ClpP class)